MRFALLLAALPLASALPRSSQASRAAKHRNLHRELEQGKVKQENDKLVSTQFSYIDEGEDVDEVEGQLSGGDEKHVEVMEIVVDGEKVSVNGENVPKADPLYNTLKAAPDDPSLLAAMPESVPASPSPPAVEAAPAPVAPKPEPAAPKPAPPPPAPPPAAAAPKPAPPPPAAAAPKPVPPPPAPKQPAPPAAPAPKPAPPPSAPKPSAEPAAPAAPADNDNDNDDDDKASGPPSVEKQQGIKFPPQPSSTEYRQYALSLHNNVRAAHAAGGLAWDGGLAAKALGWAQQCRFEHPAPGSAYSGNGQNINFQTGDAPRANSLYAIMESFRVWYYVEQSYYNYTAHGLRTDAPALFQARGSPVGEGPQVGHFVNVVAKPFAALGCATHLCPSLVSQSGSVYSDAVYTVCNFGFAGEMPTLRSGQTFNQARRPSPPTRNVPSLRKATWADKASAKASPAQKGGQ